MRDLELSEHKVKSSKAPLYLAYAWILVLILNYGDLCGRSRNFGAGFVLEIWKLFRIIRQCWYENLNIGSHELEQAKFQVFFENGTWMNEAKGNKCQGIDGCL